MQLNNSRKHHQVHPYPHLFDRCSPSSGNCLFRSRFHRCQCQDRKHLRCHLDRRQTGRCWRLLGSCRRRLLAYQRHPNRCRLGLDCKSADSYPITRISVSCQNIVEIELKSLQDRSRFRRYRRRDRRHRPFHHRQRPPGPSWECSRNYPPDIAHHYSRDRNPAIHQGLCRWHNDARRRPIPLYICI